MSRPSPRERLATPIAARKQLLLPFGPAALTFKVRYRDGLACASVAGRPHLGETFAITPEEAVARWLEAAPVELRADVRAAVAEWGAR